MRRPGFTIVSLLLASQALPAQEPYRPVLMATIQGGVNVGRELWSVPGQAVFVRGGFGSDTVALGRRMAGSLALGVMLTWFRTPHFGLTVEAMYRASRSEGRCLPVRPFNPGDPEQINAQACDGVQGRKVPTSLMTVEAGAMWRPGLGDVQPYLRAAGGLGVLGGPYVRTAGPVQSASCPPPCVLVFLQDDGYSAFTPTAAIAGGAMVRAGTASQLRIEARWAAVGIPDVLGPAAPGSVEKIAPTRARFRGLVTVAAGFDILLERRRGRRY